MKKLLILFCTTAILITSCTKEGLIPANDFNSQSLNVNNEIHLPSPAIDYVSYLANQVENEDQKKYNKSIYYITKAMAEVCKQPNLIEIIYSDFKNKSVLRINDLMLNPEIRVIVNEVLNAEHQSYQELIRNMIIDNVEYYPTMEFSNSNSKYLAISEMPVIAAGIPYEYYTIEDTLGGYVMAWKMNGEEFQNVLINEAKKDSISIPVFVLNGSTDYIARVEIGNSEMIKKQKVEESPIIKAQWRTQYSGFKIDYRYESDRFSNYRYTGVIQSVNGPHLPDEKGGLICNVHKNDIGKSIVPRWGSLQLNINLNSQTDIYIESYYVTYEYDWYSSLKTVKMQNTQIGTIDFKCRMNKPEEYYQIVRSVRDTHITHNGKGFINIYNPCCF